MIGLHTGVDLISYIQQTSWILLLNNTKIFKKYLKIRENHEMMLR